MTVSSQVSSVSFLGDGVTTLLPVPYYFLEQTHLLVTRVNLDSSTNTLVLGSDYSVSGAGNQAGGSITMIAAPAVGIQIIIDRSVPATQETDYVENDPFPAESHERALDKLTMLVQQGYNVLSRALLRPIGKNYYDAQGRQIKNVGNPTDNQDAVTKLYNEQYIAGLLSQFTGPLNNASNVILVYPDGVARSVQTLATKNDPLLGSSGIAHNNGTVRDELLSINAEIGANAASADSKIANLKLITDQNFSNVVDPAIIDLHFGTLAGVGWGGVAEPGNIVAHTITGSTSNTITLNNVTGLFAGQLICYQATDTTYYTAVIMQIGTLTLTLDRVIAPVTNGAQLYNFYRDDAHANTFGFNAVVDDSLRQLSRRMKRIEYEAKDGSIWAPVLGTTLVSQTASAYTNPGGTAVGERAISVAGTTVNAGVISSPVALSGGDYVTTVIVNPGNRTGGFSGTVVANINEVMADGTSLTIATSGQVTSIVNGSCISVNLQYSLTPGSVVQVSVTTPNSGPWTFYVGKITHFRVGGYLNSLNRGTHVLFGDSWFGGGDFFNRLVARLPQATIINKGIGGNKATDLIARFTTDVTPFAPDYVWIIVGPNDYYASVSNNNFQQQLNQLRNLVQSLGAQLIVFDAAVGAMAPTLGGGDQLPKSRSYALSIKYAGQELPPDGAGSVQRSSNFYARPTVAASSSQIIGVLPGNTRLPVLIRFLHQSVAGLQLSIEYCAAADGTSPVDVSTFTGVGPFKDQLAARASNDLRFVVLRATNPSGSGITATIIADICWQQSLV